MTDSLVEVFGPWGALPWIGTKTLWNGQPAWITEYDSAGAAVSPCLSASSSIVDCPSGSASKELLTTTLALPWLNATITVRSATAARTQELFSHVSAHAESGLGVPASASQMSITWATAYQRPQSSTSQKDIEQTLSAIRAVPGLPVSAACEIPVYLGPGVGGKVVTIESNGMETSFLVAQSPCNQVTSGTGTASRADAALHAALARVPLPVVR